MRPQERPTLRSQLHQILHVSDREPSLQRIGFWVDAAVVVCILLSCATVVAELTIGHEAHPILHDILLGAEVVFTVLFAVEYLVRWYAAPSRRRYPFTKHAIVDMLAIAPSLLMFVHVFGFGSQFLMLRAVRVPRVLRLARLLRLVRVVWGGYNARHLWVVLRTWVTATVHTYEVKRIARMFLVIVFAWVVGANALFLFERLGFDADNPSPYLEGASLWQAYLDAYWWVDIYLVSGFDAPTPVTWAARVAVTTLLLSGLLVTAVFEAEVIAIRVRSLERRGRLALMPPKHKPEKHIVILGRNDHLEKIIVEVHRACRGKLFILVVAENAETIRCPSPHVHARVFALSGNPVREDILDAARIEKARRVIVLADEGGENVASGDRDDVTLMRAIAVFARNRTVRLVVELIHPESLLYASSIETADCVLSRRFGEMLIAQAVHNHGIGEIFDGLTTFAADTNEFHRVRVPSHLVGKTFREVQEYFLDLDDEAILPVGVDGPGPRAFDGFRLAVADVGGAHSLLDRVLLDTDWLIVCAFEHPRFAVVSPEDAWTTNEIPRG